MQRTVLFLLCASLLFGMLGSVGCHRNYDDDYRHDRYDRQDRRDWEREKARREAIRREEARKEADIRRERARDYRGGY